MGNKNRHILQFNNFKQLLYLSGVMYNKVKCMLKIIMADREQV